MTHLVTSILMDLVLWALILFTVCALFVEVVRDFWSDRKDRELKPKELKAILKLPRAIYKDYSWQDKVKMVFVTNHNGYEIEEAEELLYEPDETKYRWYTELIYKRYKGKLVVVNEKTTKSYF